nr:MAG TPA: hypothetical protein [Caudoviricetes sp.]
MDYSIYLINYIIATNTYESSQSNKRIIHRLCL